MEKNWYILNNILYIILMKNRYIQLIAAVYSDFEFGGGEGNWIPVRKFIHVTFYERSLPFNIPCADRR